MKPIRVSIKGFNSFVEEQSIDFERLSAQGLFGIFGPTGSGKSTVLDAITFALYGKIARETGSPSQYININSDVARIVFQFEINTDRRESYKIIRELKRNKKDEVRTSVCKLLRTTEGEEVLAEDSREVVKAVKEIIGLEYGDFVKTVVLPQGGFNDFLKMEGKDRRDILERLFNLQQYGKDLEVKISNRIKAVESTKNELSGAIGALGQISEESLAEQKEFIEALQEQLEADKRVVERSEEELRSAKELTDNQKELLKNQQELDNELKRAEQIQAQSERLKQARRLATVESLIENYEKITEGGKGLAGRKKSLEEAHIELQLKKKDADEAFERFFQEYTEGYPRLLKRQESLEHSKKAWDNYQQSVVSLEQIGEHAGRKQKELGELQKKIGEHTRVLEAWQQKIETSKAFIQENSISQEEQNRLRETVRLLDKLGELRQKKLELEQEHQVGVNTSTELEGSLEQLDQSLKKLSEQKEAVQEQLRQIIENSYSDIAFVMGQKQLIAEKIAFCREHSARRERLDEVERLLQEQLDLQGTNEERRIQLEEKLAEHKENYEDLFVRQAAQSIRRHLHEGDLCPVCANVVSELPKDTESDELALKQIADIAETLEEEKKKLQIAEITIRHHVELLGEEKAELSKLLEQNPSPFGEKELQDQMSQLDDDYNALSEQKLGLETEQKELEAREMETSTEKINIVARHKALQEELEKRARERKGLDEEIFMLEERIKTIPRRGDAHKQLEQTEQRLARLEAERKSLDEAENARQKIEAEKTSLQKMETDAQIEWSTLQVRADGLLSNQKENEQIVIKNMGRLTDPQEEIGRAQKQIAELERNCRSANEAKAALDKQEAELQQQLAVLSASLGNLREQAREMQDQLYERFSALEIESFDGLVGSEKVHRLGEQITAIKQKRLSMQEMTAIEGEIADHHRTIAEKNGIIKSLQAKIGDKKISDEEFSILQEGYKELKTKFDELNKRLIGESKDYQRRLEQYRKLEELYEKESRITKQLDMLKELKQVLGAKKFVEFMAMKQLSYVTLEATRRLYDITNGAYSLEVDEEGSFKIRDNKNGGALRNVRTLSGGETFVVSLSLALALSAQIQLKGVAPLELFFLDEGFGTLDDDLLEIVMDSLERIHHDRLKVGIISHVEQLKQRIPVKLMVTPARMGEGGSKVRIEYG